MEISMGICRSCGRGSSFKVELYEYGECCICQRLRNMEKEIANLKEKNGGE